MSATTALAQAVGLAARMEQMADPSKALLTGHTAKFVSGYFALRDLGEARIKGLSALLHAFELEGVGRMRTRLQVPRARLLQVRRTPESERCPSEALEAQASSRRSELVN